MSYESWACINFAVKDPPSPLLATPQLPRQQTHESGWHITITFHRQVNMIFHLQELLVVFPRTKLLVDHLKQSLDITSPSPVACLYPYKWFWFSLLRTVMPTTGLRWSTLGMSIQEQFPKLSKTFLSFMERRRRDYLSSRPSHVSHQHRIVWSTKSGTMTRAIQAWTT